HEPQVSTALSWKRIFSRAAPSEASNNFSQDRQARAKFFSRKRDLSTPAVAGLALAVSVFSESKLALLGGGDRFALRRRLFSRWPGGQLHSDEFAHTAFFHGHSVENVCFRDRPFVVGNDDELALSDETIEHPHEPIDVAFIERRVDFVEHAER